MSSLEYYGSLYGIQREPGESDEGLRKRILDEMDKLHQKSKKEFYKKMLKKIKENNGEPINALEFLFGEDRALTNKEGDDEA